SYFYGISIYMYPRDHNPPHFHAIYGEFSAVVLVATGEIISGDLPRRAERLVSEWLRVHTNEIYQAWLNLQSGKSVDAIEPLQ
ncbi:MAG: hypothetical protein RLZZ534_551, partial [Actinomycetota bacterium]